MSDIPAGEKWMGYPAMRGREYLAPVRRPTETQVTTTADVNRSLSPAGAFCLSIGHTAEQHWASLARGVCGIAPMVTIPTDQLTQKVAAEVKNYDPLNFFAEREVAPLDRVAQFGVIAAREAIAHSGLTFDGRTFGADRDHHRLRRRRAIDPGRELQAALSRERQAAASAHHPAADGERAGERRFPWPAACAARPSWWRAPARRRPMPSGLRSRWCARARCRCAVTGGAEACIAFGTMKGWEALRVLAPDTCRPFSRDRKGLVIGEGAAVLVIESLEHAQKRSANILGEIVGFGMSADAGDLLSPDAGGMRRAIDGALKDGGLGAGRHPIRQRPWHRHGVERRDRDRGAEARVRRSMPDSSRSRRTSR